MKTVKILAFDGCEEIELFAVIDILDRCGINIDILSPFNTEFITTRSGQKIDYNAGYAKFGYLCAEEGEADALYIPGGQIDESFKKFTDEYGDYLAEQIGDMLERGAVVAADCVAPALLAKLGAFDKIPDYRITCYPGTEKGRVKKSHLADEFIANDDSYSDAENGIVVTRSLGSVVCVHKNLVTGNGPSAAVDLAWSIASQVLGSSKKVDEVLEGMGY
jgi:putative intracellular protease/amidase